MSTSDLLWEEQKPSKKRGFIGRRQDQLVRFRGLWRGWAPGRPKKRNPAFYHCFPLFHTRCWFTLAPLHQTSLSQSKNGRAGLGSMPVKNFRSEMPLSLVNRYS